MKKTFTLFAILLFAGSSHAVMQHTVVNQFIPNTTTNTIDMDNDGQDEFSINPFNGHTTVICLKPTSHYAADGAGFPRSYFLNQTLGPVSFLSDTGTLRNTANSTGDFGNDPTYMIVMFLIVDSFHYGWIQLSAGTSGAFVIDYAYDDVPNRVPAAGALSTTGMGEVAASAIDFMKLNGNELVFENCHEYDRVMFYTAEGRLLDAVSNPVASQHYTLPRENKLVLVAFIRNGQVLTTAKCLIPE